MALRTTGLQTKTISSELRGSMISKRGMLVLRGPKAPRVARCFCVGRTASTGKVSASWPFIKDGENI